jgi:hypothetical protein
MVRQRLKIISQGGFTMNEMAKTTLQRKTAL